MPQHSVKCFLGSIFMSPAPYLNFYHGMMIKSPGSKGVKWDETMHKVILPALFLLFYIWPYFLFFPITVVKFCFWDYLYTQVAPHVLSLNFPFLEHLGIFFSHPINIDIVINNIYDNKSIKEQCCCKSRKRLKAR